MGDFPPPHQIPHCPSTARCSKVNEHLRKFQLPVEEAIHRGRGAPARLEHVPVWPRPATPGGLDPLPRVQPQNSWRTLDAKVLTHKHVQQRPLGLWPPPRTPRGRGRRSRGPPPLSASPRSPMPRMNSALRSSPINGPARTGHLAARLARLKFTSWARRRHRADQGVAAAQVVVEEGAARRG